MKRIIVAILCAITVCLTFNPSPASAANAWGCYQDSECSQSLEWPAPGRQYCCGEYPDGYAAFGDPNGSPGNCLKSCTTDSQKAELTDEEKEALEIKKILELIRKYGR